MLYTYFHNINDISRMDERRNGEIEEAIDDDSIFTKSVDLLD